MLPHPVFSPDGDSFMLLAAIQESNTEHFSHIKHVTITQQRISVISHGRYEVSFCYCLLAASHGARVSAYKYLLRIHGFHVHWISFPLTFDQLFFLLSFLTLPHLSDISSIALESFTRVNFLECSQLILVTIMSKLSAQNLIFYHFLFFFSFHSVVISTLSIVFLTLDFDDWKLPLTTTRSNEVKQCKQARGKGEKTCVCAVQFSSCLSALWPAKWRRAVSTRALVCAVDFES